MVTVTADWAYVEAAWNADDGTDPDLGVPTSYYTSVHLRGVAEVVDDPGDKAALLARQLGHFEPADSTRVTPSVQVESDRRQLPGIRGLRIRVESVRAKQKYGGSKPVEHRDRIAEQLEHLRRRSSR